MLELSKQHKHLSHAISGALERCPPGRSKPVEGETKSLLQSVLVISVQLIIKVVLYNVVKCLR